MTFGVPTYLYEEMKMNLAELGKLGIKDPFKKRYENFIGGKWVPPVKGEYFENVSPVIGHAFTEIARSSADDIELALDAAHAARTNGLGPRPPTAPTS